MIVLRDLICARTKPPAPAATPRSRRRPRRRSPPPPPTSKRGRSRVRRPPSCPASARPGAARCASMRRRTRAPNSPPPNGGPRGSYRSFTATSGSIDVTIAVRPPGGGCALDGTGHIDLVPGFMNQVIVQLDVPNPAYVVAFTGHSPRRSRSRAPAARAAAGRRRGPCSHRGRPPGRSRTPRPRLHSTTSSRC